MRGAIAGCDRTTLEALPPGFTFLGGVCQVFVSEGKAIVRDASASNWLLRDTCKMSLPVVTEDDKIPRHLGP
jgi:hypothetical protein